jgi:hypothetical protein
MFIVDVTAVTTSMEVVGSKEEQATLKKIPTQNCRPFFITQFKWAKI